MAMPDSLPALSANGRRLIEALTELPRVWLTAATLAGAVGISRRTVLRELPGIEAWMQAAGFHFLRAPGRGLLLDEDEEQRARLRALLGQAEAPAAFAPQERRQRVLLALFSNAEPIKSYALAHELGISENTLSADLDAVEAELTAQHIALRRRPGVGIWLEATPEERRRVAGAMLKAQLLEQDWQEVLDGKTPPDTPLAALLDPDITRRVGSLLRAFDRDEALHFTDSQFLSLTVHLSFILHRLRPGQFEGEKTIAPTAQAGRLTERLEQAFGVRLPQVEVDSLALYLDAYSGTGEPDSREMNLRYLAACLIGGVSEATGVDLSAHSALVDDLCRHLRPMLLRLENHTYIENPQLALLKAQYPALWQTMRTVCDEAAQTLSVPEIPDGEVGYLAMHIGAVLEQEKMKKTRVNVVVVCPYGMASCRFLAAQLTRDFPALHVVDACPVRELQADDLWARGVQLVLSTVPLPIEYPNVRIHPILQEQDRALVQAAIETAQQTAANQPSAPQTRPDGRGTLRYAAELSAALLDLVANVTVSHVSVPGNRDALIHAAAELFCTQPQAVRRVEQALRRRETLGDTYIQPLRALLLHCRTDDVSGCRVGYLCAEPPVYEKGQIIQGAIVLLAPAAGELPREIMQAVSALLIEEPELIRALRADATGRAAALLEAGLSARFRQDMSRSG